MVDACEFMASLMQLNKVNEAWTSDLCVQFGGGNTDQTNRAFAV